MSSVETCAAVNRRAAEPITAAAMSAVSDAISASIRHVTRCMNTLATAGT